MRPSNSFIYVIYIDYVSPVCIVNEPMARHCSIILTRIWYVLILGGFRCLAPLKTMEVVFKMRSFNAALKLTVVTKLKCHC